ncbi:hypothetical protein CDO52_03730 [Nocardiopsis gilva YIM 90087]|uniref:Carrier domain-containing protein n=1 Tax=Nocardiopsis gilva YIM 90087 TaxID=1235441 RepID=A0A223S1N3_9ACTN|nr:acyl carrier protein [Nocardiopsis gilva]ASU82007.1 hypothetical protein CDO52_03730 [Nocardiopsis gilva YIM 90087]
MTSNPDQYAPSRIKKIMADRLKVSPDSLGDDMSLEALGLNSFALAEMLSAVEQDYGTRLDIDSLAERVTPLMSLRDLLTEISLTLAHPRAAESDC